MNIYLGQMGFTIAAWFLVCYMIFCNIYLISTYIKDRNDQKKDYKD